MCFHFALDIISNRTHRLSAAPFAGAANHVPSSAAPPPAREKLRRAWKEVERADANLRLCGPNEAPGSSFLLLVGWAHTRRRLKRRRKACYLAFARFFSVLCEVLNFGFWIFAHSTLAHAHTTHTKPQIHKTWPCTQPPHAATTTHTPGN